MCVLCRRCGRPLKSQQSIRRGYGEGCYQKHMIASPSKKRVRIYPSYKESAGSFIINAKKLFELEEMVHKGGSSDGNDS